MGDPTPEFEGGLGSYLKSSFLPSQPAVCAMFAEDISVFGLNFNPPSLAAESSMRTRFFLTNLVIELAIFQTISHCGGSIHP
jgi:hypothetical protein